jgi:hypothetical protein
MNDIVETVRQQPFADACQAMLRQAEASGAEIVFSDAEIAGLAPDLLRLLRI